MNSKKWLIVSILCIAVGLVLLLVSGIRNTDDLDAIMTKAGAAETLEEKTVTVKEDFDRIAVRETSADVKLLPAGDGVCRVVFGENERVRYSVRVQGDTLTVTREDKSSVSFGTMFYTREIPLQIYLPEQSYRSLLIECDSGDVLPERGFSFETAQISTASGEIKLRDFQADELQIHTASGDARLEEIRAESLRAESASGDQELARVQIGKAAELSSASGEISLEDLEAGSLDVSCTSGEVRLEKVSCAGEIRVETTSGDIKLRSAAAGSFDLHSTSGDVEGTIRGTVDFIVDTNSGSVRTRGGVRGAAPCQVSTTSGDVDLEAGN